MLTQEQIEAHKLYSKTEGKEGVSYSKIRGDAKKVNYSATYGVGAAKLAMQNKWEKSKARKLLDIYWKRNWAIKKVADNCKVKTVNGQMWLWNPVSHLWYSLRYEKDKFSTLNQSTGAYCFDTWVRKCRIKGAGVVRLCGQFHDEIIVPLLRENRDHVEKVLREAIDETNEELKLNVPLNIDIKFGDDYALIH
jgi:DNA polymerase I-like protein with 3'-5' exonuclease and polymerase domains